MRMSRQDFVGFCKEVLPDYVWDLGRYWWVIGFTVFLGIVGAVAEMADFDVPGWVWWLVALSGVFIAQFLVWNDMRNERDALRRYDVSQGTLAALAGYRGRLITLQNEPLNNEKELGGWEQRYSSLRKEVMDFIDGNVSRAEAVLFETLGDYQRIAITGKEYVNMEHANLTARVIRDHRWLAKAVEDYGRQRFRPELFREEAKNGEWACG